MRIDKRKTIGIIGVIALIVCCVGIMFPASAVDVKNSVENVLGIDVAAEDPVVEPVVENGNVISQNSEQVSIVKNDSDGNLVGTNYVPSGAKQSVVTPPKENSNVGSGNLVGTNYKPDGSSPNGG